MDKDVFDEIDNPDHVQIKELIRNHRDLIKNIGFTPEEMLISLIENSQDVLDRKIRVEYKCAVSTIITSSDYTGCSGSTPRSLAKNKMSIICDELSAHSGKESILVTDSLIGMIVEQIPESEIRQRIAPLLKAVLPKNI